MQPQSFATIETWLEAIDVCALSDTETTPDIVPQVQDEVFLPCTPQWGSNKTLDETSPTDTSFSATTIFDALLHEDPQSDYTQPSDCDPQDADCDTTTVYNENHGAVINRQDLPERAVTLDTDKTSSDQPDNTDSSHICDQEEIVRLVSLTSCLQCILLHLPCSRTYSSCTRCVRNGYADFCLLHRRRFAFEHGEHRGPVLLKVRGEEKEVWKRKLEAREALWGEWVARQERRNWVLPSVLDLRGGWRRWSGWVEETEGFPGEGLGRVTWKELVVELEG